MNMLRLVADLIAARARVRRAVRREQDERRRLELELADRRAPTTERGRGAPPNPPSEEDRRHRDRQSVRVPESTAAPYPYFSTAAGSAGGLLELPLELPAVRVRLGSALLACPVCDMFVQCPTTFGPTSRRDDGTAFATFRVDVDPLASHVELEHGGES